MPTDLETQLEQLHAPRVEPPAPTQVDEAAAILAWVQRHAQGEVASSLRHPPAQSPGPSRDALRHPPAQSPGPSRDASLAWFGAHRFAVGFAALFVLVFGACVLPTSYEIPLGLRIDVHAPPGERLPVHELTAFVRERSQAAKIEVVAREVVRDGGPPTAELSILLWDQAAALGELEPQLREQFPALANADIHEHALAGELDTIWGRRLAHRALRMPPREVDVEHARAALLIQLHASGLEQDEVVVEVRDLADGHREVEVQIERELELGELPEGGAEGGAEGAHAGPQFRWVEAEVE
jgi:hypothetical protein